MHVIEICRCGADLGAVMAQMRTWVDHHKAELNLFEVAFLPHREIRFRLVFRNVSHASACSRAFEGQVLTERGEADNAAA